MEISKNRSLLEEYGAVNGTKQQSGFENLCRQVGLAITAVIKPNIDLIEETANTA